MNAKKVDWSVYVITGRRVAGDRSVLDVVRAAIRGGASLVQLREKTATTREMVELGQAVHEITRQSGIPLIVNDRLDVALAIAAEGVHVGHDDMPVRLARRLIGPDLILGASPETVGEARQMERDGADYLGVGDVYGTPSKSDAGSPIGIDGLTEVIRAVSIPVVAIGGITLENAGAVIQAGAAGVAVISAVVSAPDPEAAARRLREMVNVKRNP
ncbi:MAG: thiamine phosphate synthase [Anaerolineae bacterium]|jgi:thiamine-phosphate pyrophosphorylase